LRAGIRREEGIVLTDHGGSLQSEPLLAFKVDEEHPNMWIFQDIAHGLVFPIAIIVGEGQPVCVNDTDKTGVAAFIRACGEPTVIAGG
jgi:hypothetical protein